MKRHARRGQAAFTLIELMVALVAGLIAISATYYVGAASQRHFSEQQRIAQTQMSVRMAMMQLERDIERAGLHGTPNSETADTCFQPPRPVQAVRFGEGTYETALPNFAANLVSADQLVLTGNYATSDAYFVRGLNSDGSSLSLQRDWQSFRRDFMADPTLGTIDTERFAAVFADHRMLKITTLQGKEFFVDIAGTNPANASIQLGQTLGVAGPCVGGLMTGAMVAPLSTIEYAVVEPRSAGLTDLVAPGSAALETAQGSINSVLVRRELDMATGAVVPNTTRVVLEYVADFDVGFVFDTSGPGVAPMLVTERNTQAETRLAPLTGNPEQVRSAIVRLSARTRRHEPTFAWIARSALAEPLTRYQASATAPGASRVRTISREIFLPNAAHGVVRR